MIHTCIYLCRIGFKLNTRGMILQEDTKSEDSKVRGWSEYADFFQYLSCRRGTYQILKADFTVSSLAVIRPALSTFSIVMLVSCPLLSTANSWILDYLN